MKNFMTISMMLLAISVWANNIILPSKAAPYEKTAQKELAAAVKKVKKGVFLNGKKAVFYVGIKPASFKGKLEDERWNIISEGEKVYLFGGGTRGTLYATAIFLEKYFGVRYWNASETLIPAHDKITLKTLNLSGKPCFYQRGIGQHWRAKVDNGRAHVMNRLTRGARFWTINYGGDIAWGSPVHVHSFPFYITEKEFGKTHPEYFALIGGKRVTHMHRGQLCLSNPDLPGIFIKKMKNYILEDEKKAAKEGTAVPLLYDMSQFDNNYSCQCDKCVPMRKKLGGETAMQLELIMKVAKEIKKFRPNVKIVTLAYHLTENPPKNYKKLPENVMIWLCNTDNNFASSILDPREKIFRDRLKKWVDITPAGVLIWDYGISFNRMASCMPYPSEFFMPEQFRYYRDNGVIGSTTQRDSNYCGDVWTLKFYLQAKFMENPDADFDTVFNDFVDKYYGPAGKYIGQYRRTLYASCKKYNHFIVGFGPPAYAFVYLDADTILKSVELFEKAEKAVANNPEFLRRVREARSGIDQAIILLQRKLEWERPGISKKLDVANCRKRWFETITNACRLYLREDRSSIVTERFKSNTDILPATVKPQTKVPGGIEIPIETIHWYQNDKASKLVLDKESETGYAAVLPARGNKKLPFGYGFYNQQRKFGKDYKAINPEDIKNGGYNWYKFKSFKPTYATYMYMAGWRIHCSMAELALKYPGKSFIPWVCIKFSGPAFPHGKKGDPDTISISRIVFEIEK